MKNFFKNRTLIFTLILSFFAFFSFSLNIKAATLYCLYGNLSIEISEKGELTTKLVNLNQHAAAAITLNSFVTKADLIDSDNNLYCPEKIYHKVDSQPRGQKSSYSFTPSQIGIDPTKQSGIYLSDSKVVNDTNTDNNSNNSNSSEVTNKTVLRKCVYGEYTLIFYTDNTVEGFRPSYSVGTANFKIPSDGYCPQNVYIASSGGRGGNYASVYSTSQGGQTPAVALTSGDTSESSESSESKGDSGTGGDVIVGSVSTCTSIFGDKTNFKYPAYWIQWCLNVIKYLAIGALLLLVTMDFFKALVQNDKDALKKAGVTAAKRFVYCILIFFLPIIVDFIMSLFGAYGTCGIG